MKPDEVIKELREELSLYADPAIAENSRRFFKEDLKAYGFKSADVNKLGKKYLKIIRNESKHTLFEMCEQLWQSGYMEEAGIACEWAYSLRTKYLPEDLDVFERWIDCYVGNWAMCDTLCNHTVGDFMQMYPESVSRLKQWALSDNRWMRRGAAVSLIIPARKGLFAKEVVEIADILLEDEDDMVRKGYGWMLKALAEFDSQTVFEYVIKNKGVMPRTSLRYAIEKMPKEMKAEAMKK